MGTRAWLETKERYPWLKRSDRWPKKGLGRYWKRRLSKARRKYAKAVLTQTTPHERGLADLESTVSWRSW